MRQVLELKPASREARFQLAAILEKLNRMDEAEKEFRRLLAEKPDDASALNYLGYSLADRGLKLAEAEGLIREAVRLDPANPRLPRFPGLGLYKQGRSTEAVSELELAAARDAGRDGLGPSGRCFAAGRADAGTAWLAWKRVRRPGRGPSAAARKAAQARGASIPEDLGELYLEDLAAVHGRPRKLSAVCRVEGEVLGRAFSYAGMLTFRPGRRSCPWTCWGRFLCRIFRVRLGAEGFRHGRHPGRRRGSRAYLHGPWKACSSPCANISPASFSP